MYGHMVENVVFSSIQWTRKKALEGQGALAQVCLQVIQHLDSATVCPENCDVRERCQGSVRQTGMYKDGGKTYILFSWASPPTRRVTQSRNSCK